ncbi:hypothetical protein [Paenibacillus lutimineralis]|uniref:Squalene cyclase C-terminal domain-containing protein n=1 Tax=Paenibacillus lutimineralis TaxID=2707005 RepID=A0A3Q9IAG9_9BACL|nr:hypothetical protein [Paenibacillus lutimineralis]AZS16411.1 hypothetical protein EI981_19450 [Paenibacillus lutimineralis]
MKNESRNVLERSKDFIYKNARLLDRMRFAYHFENGSKSDVLRALQAYQNQDGGFGNALEPDMRCPHSQPVTTEAALLIIKEVGGFDSVMLDGTLSYLQGISLSGGGLPRATTAVNDYPHAPWWTTEQDGVPSLNPTGSIIGILLGQSECTEFQAEQWFQEQVGFVWRCLEESSAGPGDYHDAMQWISFLETVPGEPERTAKYKGILDEWLTGPKGIEKNVHAEGYVHKVLDYAKTPDCYANRLLQSDNIERHLDWLMDGQQADGGWNITFPAVSPTGEQEWRGSITVDRLITLKAYGRLGKKISFGTEN